MIGWATMAWKVAQERGDRPVTDDQKRCNVGGFSYGCTNCQYGLLLDIANAAQKYAPDWRYVFEQPAPALSVTVSGTGPITVRYV